MPVILLTALSCFMDFFEMGCLSASVLPKHLFIPLSHCDKVSVLRGFVQEDILGKAPAALILFFHPILEDLAV